MEVDGYRCAILSEEWEGTRILQYLAARKDNQVAVTVQYAEGQLAIPITHRAVSKEEADSAEVQCYAINNQHCNASMALAMFARPYLEQVKAAHGGRPLDPPLAFWKLLIERAEEAKVPWLQ